MARPMLRTDIDYLTLAPDLRVAADFLTALDPDADAFTLAAFDDAILPSGKKRGRQDLCINALHGGLDQLAPRLARLNAEGAGIFVMINKGDGRWRSDANVVGIRAVWQDDDRAWHGRYPLVPSLVTNTSPGRLQRLWLCGDLTAGQHRAVQMRMAASHGHDKGASGLSRVLRLPGFWHMKQPDNPHFVRIIGGNRQRYSAAEVIAAFPCVERSPAVPPHTWRPQLDDDQRIRNALQRIPADDRETWWRVGAALKSHFGESGRVLWDEWSGTSKKYDPKTQDRVWRSFRRGGVTIGTIYHLARERARAA